MMDKNRLPDLLFQHIGKAYCYTCLATELRMTLEQIQQQADSLAEEGWAKQFAGRCSACGSPAVVIQRRVSAFAC